MRQDQLSALLCTVLRQTLTGRRRQVPEACRFLWDAFAALCGTRTYGMAGPNPISFAETEAFAHAERLPLDRHHIQILRDMDRTWLEIARSDKPTVGSGTRIFSPSGGQMITPEAFDAVFG